MIYRRESIAILSSAILVLGIGAAVSAQFIPPEASPAPTTRPAKEVRAQVVELRKQALGADPEVADSALTHLADLGAPARADLHETLKQILTQDRRVIDHLSPNEAAPTLALEQQIAALRKEARVNIDKLDHNETIPAAHRYYTTLQQFSDRLMAAMDKRAPVVTALGRHARLAQLYQESSASTQPAVSETEEKTLISRAEKALGITAEQATAIAQSAGGADPGDSPETLFAHDLWFYRTARQIDFWNEANKSMMSAGEQVNFHLVNTYREYLGILPYEADPRLVKSARGHSKEMADLKYFDHKSPVTSHPMPWDRMREAGYDAPYGENIAFGVGSGDQAFWMWFDSPGHHKNMAAVGPTALGVGQNGAYWTQNTGTGPRLMLMSADERRAALKAPADPKKP